MIAVRALALIAAILVAISIAPAHAATPTLISATADPLLATVGDRITLTIVVDHDASTTVDGAGFGADTGEFEIVSVAAPHTEPHNGASRTTLAYTLAAFSTGDLEIPPQSITYQGPDGTGSLTTNAITITIQSVLQPGDTQLRPLKPQLDLEDPAPPAIVPALFVAMLAALTAFGFVLMRRGAAMRPIPVRAATPFAPPSPPHAIARAALDAIAESDLATTDVAEYYARIAVTLRTYLSARFDFPAYAMTRTEMERGATTAGVDRWPARLIANLLEQSDAVEFAAFHPAPERRSADLTAAYEIIDLTTNPTPPTQPQPAQT